MTGQSDEQRLRDSMSRLMQTSPPAMVGDGGRSARVVRAALIGIAVVLVSAGAAAGGLVLHHALTSQTGVAHPTPMFSPPVVSASPAPTMPVAVAQLPVNPCRTTYGAAPSVVTLPPMPKSIPVYAEPPQKGLVWYENQLLQPLIAPSGSALVCDSTVSADGAESVWVHPNPALRTLPFPNFYSYSNGGACQSCAYELVCRFFSVQNPLSYPCQAAPKGERVSFIDSHTVIYTDPAGTPVSDPPATGSGEYAEPISTVVVYRQDAAGQLFVWSEAVEGLPGTLTTYLLTQFAEWANQHATLNPVP